MSLDRTVFVVDDDDAVRDSLRALLESAGFLVNDFSSATAFLAAYRSTQFACVLTDVRMPGMDGLALQHELARRAIDLPVIVMTGHGDIPLAVKAMKAGAIDFLEKPFDDEVLLGAIDRAIAVAPTAQGSHRQARERLAALTDREKDVFECLVAGSQNKVIAHQLGISPRTVEVHRARVMEKLQVRSLPELVRLAIAAGDDR